jgi:hypothetical protein
MLPRGEILGEDQSRLQRMAVVGQIIEEAAELVKVFSPSSMGQRTLLFTEPAEPTE